MSETRNEISTRVDRRPGLHFSGLVRELDLAPGQVQYHLRRLQNRGDVVVEELYGRTHYFTPNHEPWERRAWALLRRETPGDIVAVLLAKGPSPPETITRELDIARSTLSWHTDRLVAQEILGKRRDDRGNIEFTLERPIATARILQRIDPSMWAQLVGRFTRLVDQLLEEA